MDAKRTNMITDYINRNLIVRTESIPIGINIYLCIYLYIIRNWLICLQRPTNAKIFSWQAGDPGELMV